LTQAVTHIVTQHVLMTMDPVELRGTIVAEHAELAAVIASGDGVEAARMTAAHFQRQHDHFAARSPGRLEEHIEWR
jgi:DNA-binding GntR family transcriptional regulator